MITTDKVKVGVGDKVWDIYGSELDEGVILETDKYSTVIKWVSCHYPEECVHWDGTEEVEEEVFGNKQNATNALIERIDGQINHLQEVLKGLRNE